MNAGRQSPIVAVFLLMLLLGGGCEPLPVDEEDPNSPEARGQAIADKIDDDAGVEDTEISFVPTSPLTLGPEGTLYGFAFEESNNSLFVLGDRFSDGSVRVRGAVLESITDRLILAEEITSNGHIKVTIPTGDAAEFEVLDEGGLRITMTLQGTSPPSTLAVEIDSNEIVTIDEAASIVNPTENSEYDQGAIMLARASKSAPLVETGKPRGTNPQFNCPGISSIVTTADFTCALWEAVTSTGPTRTLDGACLAANGFLEGLRGSDPLPSGQGGAEFAPVTIAKLKLGVNALCAMAKSGWSVGKLLKKATLPDLLCMGVTIVEDGTRIITNGQNVQDAVCEALGGIPISTELDPVFGEGCDNTCEFAFDGQCDDGGPDSDHSLCDLGTDCVDCGARDVNAEPTEPDCSDDGICNSECPIAPPDPDCGDVEFCENFGLCCDGDGICDLARCPEQTDSDCTNFDFCDRLEVCCISDGRCDSDEFPCPTLDEDCAQPPGDPTIGVCPAGFTVNVSGDNVPALRDVVIDSFFVFSTYHAECRYVRSDGLTTAVFGLNIRWAPPSTGTPSGACEDAELGDIVSEGCCTQASTQRTVEVSYVLSTPITDENGDSARDQVLDDLLNNAVQAGVGAECP
ncbi:MAG: hypothetical protein R3E58_13920 [Phycisphaerae bacterium]|nr:hypothetical protein [Phycisphaerales bacterium]